MGQLLVFVVKFFAPFVDDVVNVADGYAAVGFAVDHADRGQAAAADAADALQVESAVGGAFSLVDAEFFFEFFQNLVVAF